MLYRKRPFLYCFSQKQLFTDAHAKMFPSPNRGTNAQVSLYPCKSWQHDIHFHLLAPTLFLLSGCILICACVPFMDISGLTSCPSDHSSHVTTQIFISCIPFLLASVLCWQYGPEALLFLFLVKASAFSFLSFIYFSVFNSAGILAVCLFSFPYLALIPVFFFFLALLYKNTHHVIYLPVFLWIVVMIHGIDFFIISPFAAGLIFTLN